MRFIIWLPVVKCYIWALATVLPGSLSSATIMVSDRAILHEEHFCSHTMGH